MRIRIIAAVMAAFFVLPLLCGTALAVELDELEDIVITEDQPAPEEIPAPTDAPITDYPETPPRPFTPAGTGTVVDNATDADGKEFYTIITPDENVFYLVIDRQRGTENVYFLNAVTEADLLALAVMPTKPGPEPTVTPTSPAPTEPEPTPTPEPEPEQGGGNTGMIILLAAVVLVGGGAGYYFKIYKPKQQRVDAEEDYDYSADEGDPYGEDENAEDDGLPPWDEDEPGGDEDE